MAITLYLYTFSKRENSTKQPTGLGTSVSVTLLDDTSLMNPTFKLSLASNPIGYNYAYVADFNRYYFIQDISSHQNFWYISCTCDVLASFKTQIGAESHYVVRSASDYDEYITDNAYISKISERGIRYVAANPISWSLGHSYIVGIVGYAPSASSQIGSVTYYHMDDNCLLYFLTYLMTDVSQWSDIALAEYDKGVQQVLINPMQYIVSAIALPVSPPSTQAVSNIKFGYYDWPVSGGLIDTVPVNNSYKSEDVDIAFGDHPQAAARGKYMNCAPFSSYVLHFGPWGDIPLDPADLVDNTAVTVDLKYDMLRGICRMLIYGKETPNNIIYSGTAQVGVNINISQVIKDPMAFTSNAVNGTIDLLNSISKLDVAGAAKTAYNTLDSGTRLKYPTVTGLPDGGSFLPLLDTDSLYLNCKYYDAVDENLTELGRPLCQVKVINTLSGYILCSDAECQINGTFDEAEKINKYLNSGFFYE